MTRSTANGFFTFTAAVLAGICLLTGTYWGLACGLILLGALSEALLAK